LDLLLGDFWFVLYFLVSDLDLSLFINVNISFIFLIWNSRSVIPSFIGFVKVLSSTEEKVECHNVIVSSSSLRTKRFFSNSVLRLL